MLLEGLLFLRRAYRKLLNVCISRRNRYMVSSLRGEIRPQIIVSLLLFSTMLKFLPYLLSDLQKLKSRSNLLAPADQLVSR